MWPRLAKKASAGRASPVVAGEGFWVECGCPVGVDVFGGHTGCFHRVDLTLLLWFAHVSSVRWRDGFAKVGSPMR